MARNKYDVDEVVEQKFDIKQLKRLVDYIRPYKGKMLFVLVLMLSSSGLGMFLPKFLQIEMDKYIPDKDIKSIVMLTALAGVIVLYSVISTRIKIDVTTKVGQDIIHTIREDIFKHLQELPFSYYDERPHGKIQVRVVNYVNNLSDLLSNGIINTITDLCNLIFILIFMFAMSPKLTLICLCGLPVLVIYVVFLKRRQSHAWQVQSNKQSNLNAYIAESINGIRVTQAFVREEKNMDIFNDLSMSYRNAWLKAVYYNFAMGPMVDLISTITTSFIYVVGVSCIINGGQSGVTVGVLIAFTAYISRFWAPINTIASFYNSLLTAISYLERIFETIDEPVEVKDAPDATDMPPIKGDVSFENVKFSYEDGVPILKDVSFDVKQGQTIAIVGPTGAGKTTIVNLLSRFYNVDSGKVLIDGIDISKVKIHSLRTQMGVMMQDSFIFSGTIMDNIRYGNKTATDEEVIKAAKTVCAHDFIMEMEDGYNTQVNERGSRLSVGQRQLISFARALLADPAILILDEATSSIDTETEIVLQEGLNNLLKGRTSFIIAHRLSTIKNADTIMYIDKGGIVEAGSHDELLENKGAYYELYMSQYM
ncbi:ABC transporter ATP-binding protein [Clostridium sp. AM27-31LB]|jgi:ATP-binding cassette, subfamily B, multidrug efflux pump|uniref:Multidrug ABC transporter ATP-binding protein n=1 Tax=Butyribacter intestini TaxID=1703332 RepID=A0AAW3JPP3_9FIRM|nr:ABC transporter ATP-binding protein [Clostridium sp. AM27-31LB]KQC84144.1 multidrug ABC transporter ATP-binding protein [Butyribacter intestini]RHT90597.1 ABC transporter ATP-binding protein [Clostridium sp. AM27-31LB]RHU71939.1 ABC transporter ATP-binding protein [Butyribacter intestini]